MNKRLFLILISLVLCVLSVCSCSKPKSEAVSKSQLKSEVKIVYQYEDRSSFGFKQLYLRINDLTIADLVDIDEENSTFKSNLNGFLAGDIYAILLKKINELLPKNINISAVLGFQRDVNGVWRSQFDGKQADPLVQKMFDYDVSSKTKINITESEWEQNADRQLVEILGYPESVIGTLKLINPSIKSLVEIKLSTLKAFFESKDSEKLSYLITIISKLKGDYGDTILTNTLTLGEFLEKCITFLSCSEAERQEKSQQIVEFLRSLNDEQLKNYILNFMDRNKTTIQYLIDKLCQSEAFENDNPKSVFDEIYQNVYEFSLNGQESGIDSQTDSASGSNSLNNSNSLTVSITADSSNSASEKSPSSVADFIDNNTIDEALNKFGFTASKFEIPTIDAAFDEVKNLKIAEIFEGLDEVKLQALKEKAYAIKISDLFTLLNLKTE